MKDSKDGNQDEVIERLGWDRREFGKILVSSAGGLSLAVGAGAQESTRPPAAKTTSPRFDFDVIIIGAGLSGLVAARELQRKGAELQKLPNNVWSGKVVVMEANSRIGGRMVGESIDRWISGPRTGYIDFGGQWIGPTQTAMLDLLADLNLDKNLFDSYEKGQSIQSWLPQERGAKVEKTGFDGDVSDLYMGECKGPHDFPKRGNFKLASCDKLLDPCPPVPEEETIWLKELLEKISVNVPCDRPWDAKDAGKLDRETFQDFLNEERAKQGFDGTKGYTQWLPTVAAHIGGSGGFEPDQVSLLHMAWTQHVGPQSETPEKWMLKGGAGQVPGTLRNELNDPKNGPPVDVRTNSPVTSIKNADGGVSVTVRTGSSESTYTARAVIVAIPPPLRQKIDFPDLPTPYVGFMYGSPMGSMTKVHAIYERPFWRDQCLSGTAVGNLKTCEFIADSSSMDENALGILTSFIAGDRNVGLSHASDSEIRDLVLEDYVHFFGERAGTVESFYRRTWNNQPWTGGAFTSYLPPRVWTRYGKEGWREPFGSIFWAGTETAERWPGYFDGAVRAGMRAVNEVLAKLNLPKGRVPRDPGCPAKVIKVS